MKPTSQDVLEHYRRTRSPFKTARALGMDVESVWGIVESNKDKRPEHNNGWGREELRKYIVARKRASSNWDNDDINICDARAKFEAGLIDMATGRDGSWEILYALPRKTRKPRPKYFEPQEYT